MSEDLELKVMGEVYHSLKGLEPSAQIRILGWVRSKLSLQKGEPGIVLDKMGNPEVSSESAVIASFDSIADIFAEGMPNTDVDKVLLASAYLQEKSGGSDLTGREINAELHNLGHRVANITSSVSGLINRKPQLMIQTRKDGKSQQAQKKYRVTVAGLNAAKAMLSSRAGGQGYSEGNN